MSGQDDEIRCEVCDQVTYSWGAQACQWWPQGCTGEDKRVCPECQTPVQTRELAERGCTAAAFRAELFD